MDIFEIANKIKRCGGNLYLVGGAVRDKLLGKEVNDEDYCVTGISSKEFERIFPYAHTRGKFFEVYDIEGKEFAMARKEKKNGKGHKEFEIQTGQNITIEEDLKRRDITINSIAQEVLTGNLIDQFNGVKDIENKMIRATSNAFLEDPLRVYRVARFSSSLNFEVEDNTINMMEKLKNELNTLSKERVFTEFRKALATNKPSNFFNILRRANVLDVHFKEIYDLIGSTQPEKYHPEGDSYNHTMIVVDRCACLTNKLEIRFSALVHDLGKGITPKEMLPHHYGHDEKGVKLVGELGKRIGIPIVWQKCGKISAKEHMKGGIFNKMTPAKQVDFITRVSKSMLGLDGMKIVVMCDKWRGVEPPNDIRFDVIGKQILEEVNGNYIKENYNVKDQRKIGDLLRNDRIKLIKSIENKNKVI
ncbi:MAG: HD domain-containing protein [Clostridia bacterium]|nr:HD domain-containing protein [Clostridia bacterium]